MGAVALFFTGMAVGMVFGIIIMGLAVAAGRDKRETEWFADKFYSIMVKKLY